MKKLIMLGLAAPLTLVGCGDDDLYSFDSVITQDGALGVQVIDVDGDIVSSARISIFDDNNNHIRSDFTNSTGEQSFQLVPGAYTLKVAAQGYFPNPVHGGIAIPVQVNGGKATDTTIQLDSDPEAENTSMISGNTSVRDNLVVLSNDVNAYSTITDSQGDYVLYNIPEGTYNLNSYRTGYQATPKSVVTEVAVDQTNVNLTVEQPANMPSVSGSITYLATQNGEVDVTVLHAQTQDVIPGAVTYTSSNYKINSLPDGEFDVWATYNNDGYVVDPDWIIKNGGQEEALKLSMQGSDIVRDFSVTGAVELISPTNPTDSVTPARVDTTTPTFKWESYSSAQSYVVEVKDSRGERIFESNVGRVTSYTYDPVAAGIELEDGKVYQWNITAFNNDPYPISFSENQMGIIEIELPE